MQYQILLSSFYSIEKDDAVQYQRRLEASSNAAGPSLRNMMFRSSTSIDRNLRYHVEIWRFITFFPHKTWQSEFLLDLFLFTSSSHSEPNIATTFWRRGRSKVITEPRTASSRFVFIPRILTKKMLVTLSSNDFFNLEPLYCLLLFCDYGYETSMIMDFNFT